MATNFLWGTVGAVKHLLTTELDSLAINTITALGPEIDNTSGAFQQGQLYLSVASAAFVDPSYMNVYIVPSSDLAGTNYPAFTNANQANLANYLAATIYIRGTTAAQKETYPYVTIPPGKFKVFAMTGGSCPTLGTGNTLDLYPTPTQY